MGLLFPVIITILLSYMINYAIAFLIASAFFPITPNAYLNGFLVMGGINVVSGFIGNLLSAPFVAEKVSEQLKKKEL